MRAIFVFAVLLVLGVAAYASETITYTYDARGRLKQVAHSGTVNNGVTAAYALDKADNRTNLTVSGAAPPVPTFSVSDATVTEGGSLVFTVTKSGTASGSLTVDFATADGTAVAGSDYTATSGTLTFASTDTSQTVSVATIDDATQESAETMSLNLSNAAVGSSIGDGQGVGTINDNDTPSCAGVSFALSSNGAVTEGAASVFTVTKGGSTSASCGVNYATANGTAAAPGDYTSKSGTLNFTSAQTSQTVSVTTIDDTTVESAETFSMSLSAPTNGATLGSPSSATATINDNDTAPGPSFSINDVSVMEGGILVFTVTKTGSGAANVNYATANGTAASTDYTATSGTLTFTSTQTTKTISVQTTQDARPENNETVLVNLSAATGGATISDSQGVGTIGDDDSGGTCHVDPSGQIVCV